MKKAISLIMILAMCLSLCACGGSTSNVNNTQNPTEDTTIPEDTTTYHELGETVSTAAVDFTLEECQFTYYMDAGNPVNQKPSCPYEKGHTHAAAPVGSCFVAYTYTITSKDRVIFAIGDDIGVEWEPKWMVTYGGNVYNVIQYGQSESDKSSLHDAYIHLINTDNDYRTEASGPARCGPDEFSIYPDETARIMHYGVIHVDPESLNDEFRLTVNVRSGEDEYEYFTYRIPARE